MFIKRMFVRGFGALKEKELVLPQGKIALVARPNESGKTAFLESVIAGLFGFPDKERATRTSLPLKKVYEPWHTDEFGLEMDVVCGDENFRIIRDFKSKRFQAINLSTGNDVTSKIAADAGKDWLGIHPDDFRRLSCISGKETLQIAESEGIRGRLEELLSGSQLTAEAASAVIEAALQKYPGPSRESSILVGTAIQRAKTQLDDLLVRHSRLMQSIEDRRGELTELQRLEDSVQSLKAEERDAELTFKKARLAEISEQIKRHETALNEVRILEEEAAVMNEYSGFPIDLQDDLSEVTAAILRLKPDLENRLYVLRSLFAESDEMKSRVTVDGKLEEPKAEDIEQVRLAAAELTSLEASFSQAHEQMDNLRQALTESGMDAATVEELNARFHAMDYSQEELLQRFHTRNIEYREEKESLRQTEQQMTEEKIYLLEAQLSTKRWTALWFVPMIAGAATGSVALLLGNMLLAMVGLGAGVVFMILTAVFWARMAKFGNAIRTMDADLVTMGLDFAQRSAQMDTLRQQTDDIAAGMGFNDPEQASEAYVRYARQRALIQQWSMARETSVEARVRLDGAKSAAVEIASRFGRTMEPEQATAAEMSAFAASLTSLAELARNYNHVQEKIEELAPETEKIQEEYDEFCRRRSDICMRAGIDEELDIEEARREFNQRCEKARRYAVLTQELIPARSVGILESAVFASLKTELEGLKNDVGDSLSSTEISPQASQDVLAEVRRKKDSALAEFNDLSASLWETMNRSRTEVPVVESEIERLQSYLAKTESFQRSSEIALSVLSEVGANARKQWSVWLNGAANEILKGVDSRWSEVVFDEELSFRVRDAVTGRWLDMTEAGSHLSAGARDQVWFAARTGICLALSEGEAMPILLDDPFLTWDDDRFRRGLKMLGEEIAPENQVLLVTCHEDRHQAVRDEDPEWFDRHVELLPF